MAFDKAIVSVPFTKSKPGQKGNQQNQIIEEDEGNEKEDEKEENESVMFTQTTNPFMKDQLGEMNDFVQFSLNINGNGISP